MLINLKGKKGLVVGIANEKSIAYGCAKIFNQSGADLAITYLNDKASLYVTPLARDLNATIIAPYAVENPEQLEKILQEIKTKWGKLDFLIHSIALCPADDLHSKVIDCSKEGFLKAMDVSCYSLIQMSKMIIPLMTEGGSIITFSYLGGARVVDNYNIMGVVKSALESTVRYLACNLGEKDIRVNAISPGPIITRAASSITNLDNLIEDVKEKSPLKKATTVESVGNLAAFLVSDASKDITGQVHYVDCGSSIIA